MDLDRANFEAIYDYYRHLMEYDMTEYTKRLRTVNLPIIPTPILMSLLKIASEIFKDEPVTLRAEGPLIVVGDLHGQIFDLLRILREKGDPPKTRYLFLGDLVDRGQFSTETVILVMVMKVLWPNDVILLRGNHEFDELCKIGGFEAELSSVYSSEEISSLFSYCFGCIPIACIVNETIVCLHGGIGPSVKKLSDIDSIKRPLYVFPDGPVTDILWSDPSPNVDMFRMSSRGSGALFGQRAIDIFLKREKLKLLVRGHQCVAQGVATTLNEKCITVFSASNYCGVSDNKAGILHISADNMVSHEEFPPLSLIYRAEAKFLNSKSGTQFIIPIEKSQLPTISVPNNEERHISTSGSSRSIRQRRSSFQAQKPEPLALTGRETVKTPLAINLKMKGLGSALTRNRIESRRRPSIPMPTLKPPKIPNK